MPILGAGFILLLSARGHSTGSRLGSCVLGAVLVIFSGFLGLGHFDPTRSPEEGGAAAGQIEISDIIKSLAEGSNLSEFEATRLQNWLGAHVEDPDSIGPVSRDEIAIAPPETAVERIAGRVPLEADDQIRLLEWAAKRFARDASSRNILNIIERALRGRKISEAEMKALNEFLHEPTPAEMKNAMREIESVPLPAAPAAAPDGDMPPMPTAPAAAPSG